MRRTALLACLMSLAMVVLAFVFGVRQGDAVAPLPAAVPSPVAVQGDRTAELSTAAAALPDPGTREPDDHASAAARRVPVVGPPPAAEVRDDRPGGLVVMARHQRDGRPAAGVNLRVVPIVATQAAGAGPVVRTAIIRGETGGRHRVATGIALGRARVGPDGTAVFASLPPGDHLLRDDRSGTDVAVRIDPGATAVIEPVIPAGVRVDGPVVRPDGAPVAGAVVEVWPSDGEVEIEALATTDWAGRFVLDDVRAGSSFGVRAEEHFASTELRTDARTEQKVRVELQPDACALEGFVVTGAQQPIADAVVHVGPLHGYGPRGLWTRTDARGHFRLFGLDCDEHQVVVRATGFQDRMTRAVVETPTQFVLEHKPE